MTSNILITGASGYLGGTLLDHLAKRKTLPAHGTIYALVRNEEQARQVKSLYDATPIKLDLSSQAEITDQLLEKNISIVFYLIDAFKADTQLLFIKALEAVGKKSNVSTHFLHTSGAKLFSGFVGHPTDRTFSDADEKLYDIQKNGRSPFPPMNTALNANSTIIEAAEAHGVRGYIFIPCIVYGKGTGFGNQISIQTTAIIRAAKATRQVSKVDNLDGTWPVCSVYDTITLYAKLLSSMIAGTDIGHGKNGYYMAASGSQSWTDIYAAIGAALAKRGVVDDATVKEVSDVYLENAGQALEVPKAMVPVQMGGVCKLQADRGKSIGWVPKDPAGHILETADAEVELILSKL